MNHANTPNKGMPKMQEYSSPDWNKILLPLRMEFEARDIKPSEYQD